MAKVPVDLQYVYETGDRNYLLFLAVVIEKVIYLKSEANRRMKPGG